MPNSKLVVIGSSTGGPKILEEMFAHLPVLNAPIVIIQHITPMIDQAFVSSLGQISKMPVSLAKNGELLVNGHVYIAPGGIHLSFIRNQALHLAHGEKVNSVCPSIDVAMKSLSTFNGGKLIGVILTGMGSDGANGISHMKRIGGITISQDQKTSVIYGMPKAAFETGHIDFVLPTLKIGEKLCELAR